MPENDSDLVVIRKERDDARDTVLAFLNKLRDLHDYWYEVSNGIGISKDASTRLKSCLRDFRSAFPSKEEVLESWKR